MTLMRTTVAKLRINPMPAAVNTSLTKHFKSTRPGTVKDIIEVLEWLIKRLPAQTYECEATATGMCSTADAYTAWIFGDIHLCPLFFTRGTRNQATTIIHEAAHLIRGKLDLGYSWSAKYAKQSTFAALLNADPYAELCNDLG
jgi:hypothetical protein